MKKLSCLLAIFVMVAALGACGTDDTAAGRNNGSLSDAGSDTAGDAGTDTQTDTMGGDGGGDASVPGDPCASDEDCTAPQICVVDRSGDAVEMTCQDPTGSGELGDACSADSDCASNLCVNGQCSKPCERPVDCSDDGSFICDATDLDLGAGGTAETNVCVPKPTEQCTSDADCASPERCIAIKGATEVTFECGTPNSGGGDVGDSCTADSDCAQNLCQGDVCSGPCASNGDCSAGTDFSCEIGSVDLGNGSTDNAQICSAPRDCSSDADCRIGEVCRVDRATGETTCGTENPGGGGLGDICTGDQACGANLCNDGRFRQACTTPCSSDSDCAEPGYECDTASIDDGNGGTNDVSVCVAKDPPSCTSNDDCATGLSCAIVPNAAGDALESVCVPSAGGRATGVACTADDECASLVCIDDVCSAPCTVSTQCATGQLCQNDTITKQSLSGDFDVCETLADERCDQTGTCSDGVRMCNDIRNVSSNPQTYEGYCGMPNNQASGGLGDHRASANDCRSRLCSAGTSDECSVICASDGQCAASQICTTLGFQNSPTQMGFCRTSCTDNASCAGLDFTDSNGNDVEHVCTFNENVNDNDIDQFCTRSIEVDPNDPTVGLLGDDCTGTNGGADNSMCQTGLCLRNTVFNGTSCTTAADCAGGQVCDTNENGVKQCGDRDFFCTSICDDAGDCSGGVAGNPLTACDPNISVTLSSGDEDAISACATPNN